MKSSKKIVTEQMTLEQMNLIEKSDLYDPKQLISLVLDSNNSMLKNTLNDAADDLMIAMKSVGRIAKNAAKQIIEAEDITIQGKELNKVFDDFNTGKTPD